MHFMLETIIAAHLLGIDAFDQPAVEEGKVLAKKYLTAVIVIGRAWPGHPAMRKQGRASPSGSPGQARR